MNTVLARTTRLAGVALLAAALGACSMFGGSEDEPAKTAAAKPAKETPGSKKPASADAKLKAAQSELAAAKTKPKPPPGANKPYPNLAAVPDKKPVTTTTRQRMRIEEGLFADRKNARYVNGPVAGAPEPKETVPTGRHVKPVVVQPGSARQVAAVRRRAARIDGVRIVTSGLLATIAFGTGETSLPAGSGRVIVRIAQLQHYTKGRLTIVGYAAKGEGPVHARALARARAVANGLVSLGIPGSQMRVSGSRKPGKPEAAVFISGGKAPRRPRGR